MRKLTLLLATCVLVMGTTVGPASAGSTFNPFRTARAAVDLGLDTAKRAVDLGIETAEEVAGEIEDAVTPDNCRPGTRYKDTQGRWHTCR